MRKLKWVAAMVLAVLMMVPLAACESDAALVSSNITTGGYSSHRP